MAEIYVKWYKMGTEFTYNIWYSSAPTGPWIKHNKIRLSDSILSNESTYDTDKYNQYRLIDLEADKTYYVKVTCQDKYDSWWIGYEDISSVGGGYGHDEDAPEGPFNNTIGFKIKITKAHPWPI